MQQETPIYIDGIDGNIYAGFWRRLGSILIDTIVSLPIVAAMMYLNTKGRNFYFYTLIPVYTFTLLYHVYLTKRYGGTVGKLMLGMKVIKLNGEDIGWREALLRFSITLLLGIIGNIIYIYCLLQVDETTFNSLSHIARTHYISSFAPGLLNAHMILTNIWAFSELIVMLTNERKRAIHDYMAGTVIIKADCLDAIRSVMNTGNDTNDTDEKEISGVPSI